MSLFFFFIYKHGVSLNTYSYVGVVRRREEGMEGEEEGKRRRKRKEHERTFKRGCLHKLYFSIVLLAKVDPGKFFYII